MAYKFDFESSRVCRGDSGSPLLTDSEILSLVSTGDVGSGDVSTPSGHFSGPALTRGYTRGMIMNHGLDRDDDDVESWQDNCDTRWNPNQSDIDNDGVGDLCDPCVNNPSQDMAVLDADGDGYVNCGSEDPCPSDPRGDVVLPECVGTYLGEAGDSDCDGICDGSEVCDRELVPNQFPIDNSNLEAELRWGAEVLPDSCDPVLVPRGSVDATKIQVEVLSEASGTFFKTARWIETRDWVKRQHMPSRNTTAGEPASVAVNSVLTDARFCQPGAIITNCRADAVIDERELRLDLAAIDELSTHAYHRITLGGGVRGARATRNYDDGSDADAQSLRWNYKTDSVFWTANNIVDIPPNETDPVHTSATASGLDGVMWFHAASAVGHPGDAANNVGTNIHPGPVEIDNTTQLASSYFALDPESIQVSEAHFPLDLAIPRFAWRDLPRWPDDDYRRLLWGIDPFDDLMIFETTDRYFGYLRRDGLVQPLTDIFSPALQTSLAADYLWLGSEEPWSHFAADGAPLAVGMNPEATGVLDGIVADPDTLRLTSRRDPRNDNRAMQASPMATPPKATDFAAIYSRSIGAVFRIDGVTPAGETGGLWRFDALDGSVFEVFQPLPLGAIQAVTFDAKTRELVVLDQLGLAGAATMRLIRVDVFGRGSRIVKSWPRDGSCGGYSLLMDGRNRLVMSANHGSTPKRHVLYALSGEGPSFVSRRLHRDKGVLASKPWSNELKVFLPVRNVKTSAVSIVTLDNTVEGSAVDVAKCF